MGGPLAEVRWMDLAPQAVGAGVFAMLLLALVDVDPADAEMRSLLVGLLGLVGAVAASSRDGAAPPEEASSQGETSWHEYDGAFRGL